MTTPEQDVSRGTPDAVRALFGVRQPLIERYAELLSGSGLERGLIGPREGPRLWDRHIINCAVVQELVPPSSSLADVGTGAGLPGLVLAIARPDLTVTLIEPLLRRVTWLGEVIAELGMTNVELIRGRAEQVAQSGAQFDIVTARAVAALPALAGFCLPLVPIGGTMLALKGASAEQELLAAQPALSSAGVVDSEVRLCGGTLVEFPTTVVVLRKGALAQHGPAEGVRPRKARGGRR